MWDMSFKEMRFVNDDKFDWVNQKQLLIKEREMREYEFKKQE